MKAAEIRELTPVEIGSKIADLTHELFNLRFQHATGQVENPMKLKAAKRKIARFKTILREKELVAAREKAGQ